ncbi:autotransporter-associated beta strand repeat-containing protein [Achromobacter sp. HNDS-1]|uniref:Autotransporter-associated beta strand repeat-containing protein n=1 Tax=Achromobacter sp. HNDS-1 TaxID=3151598 RepID=A0AAU7LAH9_9BURK
MTISHWPEPFATCAALKKDSAGATSAPRVPFRLNRTTAALCAGLMVSGSFSTAIAATGVQTVSLPAQEDPYSLEEVDGLGATGSSAYVISSPDGAHVEANRVSVDGRTVVTGGKGSGVRTTGGSAIRGAGFSVSNAGILLGGSGGDSARSQWNVTAAASAGSAISGSRLNITNRLVIQGGSGSSGMWDYYNWGQPYSSAAPGGLGGNGIQGDGLRIINAGGAQILGGGGGAGGRVSIAGYGAAGGDGGAAISGSNLTIVNSGDIEKGAGGTGSGTGQSGQDGAAISLRGGVNSLTLEAGSSIDGNIVLLHDDKTLGAPRLSILNRGGSSARVKGDVIVGAGADAGFAGNPMTVDGSVRLGDGAMLSITSASAPSGESPASMQARTVSIGTDVGFNLSGVGQGSATDALLFSATGGKIEGDFAHVAIGGKKAARDAADPTQWISDYLTLRTRKSDDGEHFLGSWRLAWFDTPPKAHGTFPIGDDEAFTVGAALSKVEATDDWDGNSLTKQGAGTLILSGDNTYSGDTVVEAGTLRVGNNGTTGAVAGNIVNQGELVFERSDAATYAGVISGAGTVTQAGTGALTLSNQNTYTGATAITAGTLYTAVADAMAYSTALSVWADAEWNLDGHSQTLAAGATLTNRGVIRTAGADLRGSDLTITNTNRGSIDAGDGALVLAGGANTLTLERGARMVGGVKLSAGADTDHLTALRIVSNVDSLVSGTLTAAAHTRLTLAGKGLTFSGDAALGAGALAFEPGSSLSARAVSFDEGATVSAGLTGWDQHAVRLITTAGGITGAWRTGEVLLDGLAAPEYGYLNTDGRNMQYSLRWDGLDAAASGTFHVADGKTFEVTGALSNNTAQVNPDWDGRRLTKAGGGTLILSADNLYDAGTRVLEGTLQLGKGGATGSVQGDIVNEGLLVFDHGAEAAAYAGQISGSGSVAKNGAGTMTLTGDHLYTGRTTINAGTLRIGDGGATGSLQANVANNAALVFNRGDSLTYGGRLSGTGSLTQAGAGTLILTGTNIYSGDTRVDAGTLQFGAPGADTSLNVLSGGITVAPGATLARDPSATLRVGGNVMIGAGSTLLLRDTMQTTSSSPGLTMGTLNIGADATLHLPNFVDRPAADVELFRSAGAITGDFAHVVLGEAYVPEADYRKLTVRKSGGSFLAGYGLSWYAHPSMSHGTFTLDTDDTVSEALKDVAASTDPDKRWNGASLTKQGLGTLTLTGENSYRGGTVVRAGTLRIGDGGTAGVVTGNMSIEDGAALVFDHSDDVAVFIGTIAGAGTITKKGTNTLSLWADGRGYAGVTTIEGGTLQVGSSGYGYTLAMLAGDIIDHGTLEFRAVSGQYNDVISGSGGVKVTSSDVTFVGENAYGGLTTLDDGKLHIGNHGTTGSLAGDIHIQSGSVSFQRSDAVEYGGMISGAGSVTQGNYYGLGSGTLTLTGENTYTGGTWIYGGTLRIGKGGTAGSVVGNISNSGALVFDRSDDVQYTGVVSGGGSVTQNGGGRLLLTAANTYTGDTLINAGVLQLGDGGTGGSVAGNIVNNATLIFDRGNAVTYAGRISGNGALIKQGANTLTLGASNTYGGSTAINAGTLRFAGGAIAANTLGDRVTVADGASLAIQVPASVRVSDQVALQQGSTLALQDALKGIASGPGLAASKVSIGDDVTLALSGIAHKIQRGVLLFSADEAIEGEFSRVATDGLERPVDYLTLTTRKSDDGKQYLADYDLTWLLGNGQAHGLFTVATGLAQTIEDALTNADASTATGWDGGSLTKQGGGTLVLTGDNTYTGATTIAAGTLALGAGGATGSVTGDVVNQGALVFNRGDAVTYSGEISGTGTVTKKGTNTLTLTGDNTYTGRTTIEAGSLRVGDGGASGALAGDIAFQNASGSLVFDRSDASRYGGVVSGAVGVAKNGAGTLVLSGDNTYTGGTVINAGALQLGDGGVGGSVRGNIVNNGALVFDHGSEALNTGDISGTGTVIQTGAGVQVLGGGNSYSGDTAIRAGTLRFGNGTAAVSTLAGGIDVADGATLSVHAPATVALSGAVVLENGATLSMLDPLKSGAPFGNLTASKVRIGDNVSLDLSGFVHKPNQTKVLFSAADGIEGDFARVRSDGFQKKVDYLTVVTRKSEDQKRYLASYGLSWLADNGLEHGTFTLAAGEQDTVDVSLMDVKPSAHWDGASLTKQGAGMLTLTGDHIYSGDTTIAAGTLALGAGGNTGSITGDIANRGTLVFNRANAATYAGVISGAGVVTKKGPNVLTLAGDNTYTGLTTVEGGTLRIGDGGTSGSLASDVTFTGLGSMVFDRSDASQYAGVIKGGGVGVQKNGAGTLILSGDNTYTGNTVINAGVLQLGDGRVSGSVGGAIVNNAVLAFDRSDAVTFSNAISGTGDVIKRGNNTLTLRYGSTHKGETRIEAGTLKIGVANAFAQSSGLTVAPGATLNLGGPGYQAIRQLDNRGIILFNDQGAPAAGGGIQVVGNMRHGGMLMLNTCADCAGQVYVQDGDWVGDGGTVSFGTVLGGDASKTDQLRISGAASGTTYVVVTNEGGAGAQTIEGIELIQTGTSTADAFVQNGRIVAGAYDYRLQKGSASGKNENSWYLTSLIASPEKPSELPADEPVVPPVEVPAEPPSEKPSVPPVDVPAIPPADEPAVPPVEVPAQPPAEKPSVPPVDVPAIPPADEPAVPPVEVPAQPPAEKPSVPPVDAPEAPSVDAPVVPPADKPEVPSVDAPVLPPADEPVVPPVEVPAEPPAEKPSVPPVDVPAVPPADEPVVPPAEVPAQPPAEKPSVPPVDVPAVPPADEPVVPPVEEPAQPPAEKPSVPPVDVPAIPPADEPAVPPVEVPAQPPSEKPSVPPVDVPAVPPADEPVVPPVEEPAEPPSEKPSMPPVDAPVVPPADKPEVPSVDAPVLPPADEPAVPPVEVPAQPPAEKPSVPPVDVPAVPPADEPVVPPVEVPAEPPAEKPSVPPVDVPAVPPADEPVVPPGGCAGGTARRRAGRPACGGACGAAF